MLLGGAMAGLRKLPGWLLKRCVMRITASAFIGDGDYSLKWLWGWLANQRYFFPARHFVARSVQAHADGGSFFKDKVLFTPFPGFYFFSYRGKIAWASFNRDRIEKENSLVVYNEYLILGVLFGQDSDIRQMIADAKVEYESQEKDVVSIFAPRYSKWICAAGRAIREPSSLVLEKGLYEDLIDDIVRYQNSRDRYLKIGIPWRRGYLLHGEPGNGKTSLVLTVAGQIGADIYTLNLAAPGMCDEKLEALMLEIPPGNIILLEEVDVAFDGRSSAEASSHLRVTFTGLLNVLDGVATGEGRIVFMTTNCLEKLDKALIRPGRVDRLIHIGNATREQIERMYLRFHPDALAHEATAFAQGMPDRVLCMAEIQEILVSTLSKSPRPMEPRGDVHILSDSEIGA